MPDELIWAIRREREEEARNVQPHTARKPDPERIVHETRRAPLGSWIAPSLKAGSGFRF
jgi:hypothetical protein